MSRRLGGLVILIIAVSICKSTFAKLEVHPSVSISSAITPNTAYTATKRANDYYNDFGGSVALVWNNKWEASPALRLGVDTTAGQIDTYTNPGLELAYYFSDTLQERMETSWLVANQGGYVGALVDLHTRAVINDWFIIEGGPQYFYDTINTQQVEGAIELDFNATKWLDFTALGALGYTWVSGQPNVVSYTSGGGLEITFAKYMHWAVTALFAHGLCTDSPYAILNSTTTVNVQTGSRPPDTALDPGGNTVTVSTELSAEF